MDSFEWQQEESLSIWRSLAAKESEFLRLAAEPCQKTPVVGDRVLVAVGLLGMGHPWVRMEGVVLEVGDTACFVRLKDRMLQKEEEEWVHNTLITDVLARKGH